MLFFIKEYSGLNKEQQDFCTIVRKDGACCVGEVMIKVMYQAFTESLKFSFLEVNQQDLSS